MAEPRDYRQADLIDMGHPRVRLAGKIDWGFPDRRFGEVYAAGGGQPPLPVRLIAGLFILNHMHSLSDETVRARWVENPDFQYFCGERVFRHALAFDRSSLMRWRRRLGEERLSALLQESLRVAHEMEALATKELERVAVDTTMQPKAIAHPTDARLAHKAIEKLVGFAKRHGLALRQSDLRVSAPKRSLPPSGAVPLARGASGSQPPKYCALGWTAVHLVWRIVVSMSAYRLSAAGQIERIYAHATTTAPRAMRGAGGRRIGEDRPV